ncbi:MAG: hypothetical protein ACOXZR_03760 [Bacilli bacterium]
MDQENEKTSRKKRSLNNEDDPNTLFSRETLIEKNAHNMEIAESMFDNDSLTEEETYQTNNRKAIIKENDLSSEDE